MGSLQFACAERERNQQPKTQTHKIKHYFCENSILFLDYTGHFTKVENFQTLTQMMKRVTPFCVRLYKDPKVCPGNSFLHIISLFAKKNRCFYLKLDFIFQKKTQLIISASFYKASNLIYPELNRVKLQFSVKEKARGKNLSSFIEWVVRNEFKKQVDNGKELYYMVKGMIN